MATSYFLSRGASQLFGKQLPRQPALSHQITGSPPLRTPEQRPRAHALFPQLHTQTRTNHTDTHTDEQKKKHVSQLTHRARWCLPGSLPWRIQLQSASYSLLVRERERGTARPASWQLFQLTQLAQRVVVSATQTVSSTSHGSSSSSSKTPLHDTSAARSLSTSADSSLLDDQPHTTHTS